MVFMDLPFHQDEIDKISLSLIDDYLGMTLVSLYKEKGDDNFRSYFVASKTITIKGLFFIYLFTF